MEFTFIDHLLESGAYAIVARNPMHAVWADIGCTLIGKCSGCPSFYIGPVVGVCGDLRSLGACKERSGVWQGYSGSLSNTGERVTLSVVSLTAGFLNDGAVIVDSIHFLGDESWPRRPGGTHLIDPHPRARYLTDARYRPGATLERASVSLAIPSDDGTLWRSSLVAGGTPCLPYVSMAHQCSCKSIPCSTGFDHIYVIVRCICAGSTGGASADFSGLLEHFTFTPVAN